MLNELGNRDTFSSPYVFDPRLRGGYGAFRDTRTGRVVSNDVLRSGLEDFIDARQARVITQSLQIGDISLAEWQLSMRSLISDGHLLAYSLGRGGWESMTQADLQAVSEIIRSEWRYLDGFAAEIFDGKQFLDGTALARAGYYEGAFFSTYSAASGVSAEEANFTEERSILDAQASHCDSCLDEAGKGWQPLGTLIPIGERDCMSNCRCHMEYRRVSSEDGEEIIIT